MPVEETFDDEFLARIREQPDPLVIYFIVRKSLKMSPGKTAAQCAHAAQMIVLKDCHNTQFSIPGDHVQLEKMRLFRNWLVKDRTISILVAKDSNFEKIKEDFDCLVVRDAGRTEVNSGSETVIALWPMRKSQAPRSIKKLQAFK